MAQHYLEYTDQDVINNAAIAVSMSQLLRSLGLKVAGGNYGNMRRTLHRLGVDCSHWTGQTWNIGKQTKDWSQ